MSTQRNNKKQKQPSSEPSTRPETRSSRETQESAGSFRGPNSENAEDLTRLQELSARPIMDVTDLAWLYGISVNTAYNAVKKGEFPSRRFGDRFRVLTESVFAELYPNGIPKQICAARENDAVSKKLSELNGEPNGDVPKN